MKRIRGLLLIFLCALLASCRGALPPATAIPQTKAPSSSPTFTPPPTHTPERVPLVIFAAGSLIIPFDQIEKAFEAKYPNIDVLPEYHGSIQVMRHATELHESIDVVATADASLIPMLMYANQVPETGQPYADWYIRFASNRLALAFNDQSKYANEINADNWYEIVSQQDLRTGIADPRFDAAGYRALMTFALANDYYQDPKIFTDMFAGRLPVTIFQDEDLTTVTVPEIVDPTPGTGLVMRGASVQLLALLEANELDYAFEYESVIQQHGLRAVELPDPINLGSPDEDYSHVVVVLDFQRFQSVKPEFYGERIGYGITIPSNAPHPEEAALFISFLLGPEGRAIMEANYHPVFDEPLADGYENLPTGLQALSVPANPP